MREEYLTSPEEWNKQLQSAGGDTITLVNEKGSNVRYLCQDAQRTYSFKPGASYNAIKDAGASVRDYHLRLVTSVRVRKMYLE